MSKNRRSTLTTGRGSATTPESEREGRISGHVLKIVRRTVDHTQESLAEQIGVDTSTLQGWESGRRPLMAVTIGQFLRLRHLLLQIGAAPQLLMQLDTALEADRFLGYVLGASSDVDLERHPLATWVITRPFTDLVAWPFTGNAPSNLDEVPSASGRGMSSSGPKLAVDERRHITAHLRAAAEQADHDSVKSALLRRQAHYVAGFDSAPETVDWLATMQRAEQHRLGRAGEWSPSWAVVRSGAHSLARAGDAEALPRFIDVHVSTDSCEIANLNYWAYWLGEVAGTQSTDTFMAELDVNSWRGDRLLLHLTMKLLPGNPYIDVVVHTLWSLVIRKPELMTAEVAEIAAPKVCRLLDERRVSPQSQRELESVLYALRMAQRRW